MTSALQVFNYKDKQVRTVEQDGEVWFVSKDVCDILEISKYRDAVSNLDEDERGSVKVDTLGGRQEMTAINEPGLYSLIFRSNKPEAKQFSRWVRHEVLPSIRQTGSYTAPNAEPLNLRVRVAEVLQRLALQVSSKAEREEITREAYKYATGQELPKSEPSHSPRIWTAKQIAAALKWPTEAVIHRAVNLGIGHWNGDTLSFNKAERKKFLDLVGRGVVKIADGYEYNEDGYRRVHWRYDADAAGL
ncbi:MAG: Bro-N domain-containing protein [Synergistaceae bacterium]|nr:Bro-N domain-containing protein [Synergistaceae bacterium]